MVVAFVGILLFVVAMSYITRHLTSSQRLESITGGFATGTSSDHLGESPELNLRFTQFGVFSPVFRSHCRYCDQRIWIPELSSVYAQLKKAHLRRNALVPYIYTAAHEAEATGVSIAHPCYFADPAGKHPQTYDGSFAFQYFFGADLVVAPITRPVDPISGAVFKDVWLPPVSSGRWVRWNSSGTVSADAVVASGEVFTLEDVPVWVRAGAVIPTRNMQSVSRPAADPLIWQLWHGGVMRGGGKVVEDDGETMAYSRGQKAEVVASYACASAACTSVNVTIGAPEGSFEGQPKMRSQQVAIAAWTGQAPRHVAVNGKVLAPSPAQESPGFWILQPTPDGVNPVMLVVDVGPQRYSDAVQVEIVSEPFTLLTV